ncbi:hypothetical protein PISMIDRAFT_551805 [Pisolithus microcarpus 441]|uniref:Uncharacterized protein n=1 Tax=Pisolithus microcarpus 441 TaxID=765257 RepID=A0A0C9YUP3_9AGAM|nr:hypothetical protein PISMIDRAFT_551805 [Pisolithus microcarpus 441]
MLAICSQLSNCTSVCIHNHPLTKSLSPSAAPLPPYYMWPPKKRPMTSSSLSAAT